MMQYSNFVVEKLIVSKHSIGMVMDLFYCIKDLMMEN